MGIGEGAWIQLWSGLFGSFVAALIGGLVALLVVRLTNGHQSRLAVEAREKAAISDLVASSNRLLTEYAQGERAVESLIQLMDAAAVRWRMELAHEGMAEEVERWPLHLAGLGRHLYEAEIGGRRDPVNFKRLADAVFTLRSTAMDWHRMDVGARDRQVSELIRKRELG